MKDKEPEMDAIDSLLKSLMDATTANTFDVEAVCEKEVRPLIEQVYALCVKHGIPLLIAVCLRNQHDGATISTTTVGRDNWAPLPIKLAFNVLKGKFPSIDPPEQEAEASGPDDLDTDPDDTTLTA